MSELSILEMRRRKRQEEAPPTHLDACRFDDDDFTRFGELWNQYERVDYIKGFKSAPQRPSPDVEALLQAEVDKQKPERQEEPRWLKNLIDNRDRFMDCALYNDDGSPMPWLVYKLILCTQNPRRACFLQCTRKPRPIPDISAMGPGIQPELDPFVFDFFPLTFYDQKSVPISDDSTVSVATDMYYIDQVVHHVGYAFGYEDFARFHPVPRRQASHGPSKAVGRSKLAPDTLVQLMLEYPWLTMAEIEAMIGRKEGGGAGASTGGTSAREKIAETELPEDLIALVATELDDAREALENVDDQQMYFYTKVLGGEWAQKRVGHAASDVGSYARGNDVKLWCRSTGFAAGRTFSLRAYGHENARVLAEQVARRGNYFYSRWIEAGAPTPYSFDEVAENYDEGEDFAGWLQAQLVGSKTYKEALKISQMVPM